MPEFIEIDEPTELDRLRYAISSQPQEVVVATFKFLVECCDLWTSQVDAQWENINLGDPQGQADLSGLQGEKRGIRQIKQFLLSFIRPDLAEEETEEESEAE